MKIAVVAAVLGICAIAGAIPTIYQNGQENVVVADKVLLQKQKDILLLLMHVTQPTAFTNQFKLGQSFDIESSLDQFINVEAVKEFVQHYKHGLLPRGAIFSILNNFQQRQVVSLFKVFYYAKDFETFYKVACWARNYINEGMFVYALNVAILHRPDCQGITLPPPYEVYPYYFVNTDIITKARKAKLQNFALYKPEVIKSLMKDPSLAVEASSLSKQDYQALILGKYRTDYNVPFEQTPLKPVETSPEGIPVVTLKNDNSLLNLGQEQRSLSYFINDIDLNTYYYYYNLVFPTWMNSSMTYVNTERRGELFYYFHQQIIARYYLEQLSNGLDSIHVKPSGYVSTLQYENGLPFPVRPNSLIFEEKNLRHSNSMDVLEKRILDVIDAGLVVTEEGNQVPLYTPEGLNILGNLIQNNADSVNPRFIRDMSLIAKYISGNSIQDTSSYNLVPSVLEHYETAMRDPAFYSIYKRIVNYFIYYKRNLPAYKHCELFYPGVKIQSVNFDELVTYFDYYDIDLTNAIDTDFTQSPVPRVLVKSRQIRLNHVPYNFKINVKSDKITKAVVRVFLGPKYDELGNILTINENRVNFYELDKFVYDLQVGQNVIVRDSRQAHHTIGERSTFFQLYKKMMMALDGKEQLEVGSPIKSCGFPNRLLLPKGHRDGMEFRVIVMVSPFEGDRNVPMGFPLDRKIDLTQMGVPNIYIKDVTIYHKKYEDVLMMNKVVRY